MSPIILMHTSYDVIKDKKRVLQIKFSLINSFTFWKIHIFPSAKEIMTAPKYSSLHKVAPHICFYASVLVLINQIRHKVKVKHLMFRDAGILNLFYPPAFSLVATASYLQLLMANINSGLFLCSIDLFQTAAISTFSVFFFFDVTILVFLAR